MKEPKPSFLIILTWGMADSGKRATLALGCALSSLSLGNDTTIYLTGDGAVWAFEGATEEIELPGHQPLGELFATYMQMGGKIVVCEVCFDICCKDAACASRPRPIVEGVQRVGCTTAVALANRGGSMTF